MKIEVQHRVGSADVPVSLGDEVRPRPGCDEATLRARIDQAVPLAASAERRTSVLAVECAELKMQMAERVGAEGVLDDVARRLRRHLAPGDALGCVGDGGFALLLASVADPTAAQHVAGALLQELSRPVDCGLERMSLRPSIGVAWSPDHGERGDTLLAAALDACQRACEEGGDAVEVATRH